MQPSLKLIESFVQIVSAGSLSQAENLTGQSKATLSRQLLKLEQLLGTQLLTRTTRKLVLTEAGRAYHAHCESLLTEMNGRLELARNELQALGAGQSGTLSLLSDTEFSTTFVCHVARMFLERYPNVVCHLNVAGHRQSPGVSEVDCYICADPPDLPNLIGKLLGSIRCGLYASPAYVARKGLPASPADLASHEAIVLRESGESSAISLHSSQGQATWTPRPAIVTNDHWVMKTFCMDGFGMALLPDFFAYPELSRGLLVRVLPQWHPDKKRIYCAYQKQRFAGGKLAAFINLMTECVDQIDTLSRYVAQPSS